MQSVIELQDLAVRLGSQRVLEGLTGSLTGKAIGLLGPNGAGKTTLIHTLLGFHPPASGSARIFGLDVVREAKTVRQMLGYMPEQDAFIAGMTGVHFVRQMAELSGLPSHAALERAHEAMFYVGLGEARYRPLESYSLGMKQRAKLAQALVHGPRLLFLDEPTNGLDPPARQRMLRLIAELRDAGDVRLVFSSHLLRDVEDCCDEVIILRQGKIAAYCNLEEERRTNRSFLELDVRGNLDAFVQAASQIGVDSALHGPRRLKMVLSGDVGVYDLYRLADEQGAQLRRVVYKRDSLEDIFLKAMGPKAMEGGGNGGL